MLRKLHEALAASGIRLHLVGAHARVRDVLHRGGIDTLVGGIERGSPIETCLVAIGADGAAA